MKEINPCPHCGSPALEQVRGEMGPTDYYQDRADTPPLFPWGPGRMVNGKIEKPVPYFEMQKAALDQFNRDDWRISCSKCDHATEWSNSSPTRLIERWNNGS